MAVHGHVDERRRFEDAVRAALADAPDESYGVLVGSTLGLTGLWHRQGPDAVDEVMGGVLAVVERCAPADAVVARVGELDIAILAPGGMDAVAVARSAINHALATPVASSSGSVSVLLAMAVIAAPNPAVVPDEVFWCVASHAIASRAAFMQVGLDLSVVGDASSVDEVVLRLIAAALGDFELEACRVELGDRTWQHPVPVPDRPPERVFDLRTPWSRIGRWHTWGRERLVHSPWLAEQFQAVSLLLERAMHLEASELRSRLDPLTGLLNREGLAHAMRDVHAPYAVAVVDIDHFKEVNDQHGHDVGDRFLFDLGRLLSQGRASDLVARWGGEELVMVMPATTADGAAVALRRLLDIAKETIVADGTSLSFSAGVAVVEDELLGLTDGIRAADHAMYEAKREGRSRVVVAKAESL